MAQKKKKKKRQLGVECITRVLNQIWNIRELLNEIIMQVVITIQNVFMARSGLRGKWSLKRTYEIVRGGFGHIWIEEDLRK